jgi:hypothetical protein
MDSGPSELLGNFRPLLDRYAEALAYLRRVDTVLGRLIDEHPDFDPRRWVERLPKMDAFGGLLERWRPYRSLAAGYLFLSEFEAKP